jgi:hypothetical protein
LCRNVPKTMHDLRDIYVSLRGKFQVAKIISDAQTVHSLYKYMRKFRAIKIQVLERMILILSLLYIIYFVDDFLDAFEIYDYNQLCEEFQTLLITGDSSSEGFSTRIYHILYKFNLDDMSFVLNLLYDACVPFIQSYSITNDEPITNPITQLREEFCSWDEKNPSENFEQAEGGRNY